MYPVQSVPEVSVLVTAFNAAEFLSEAIESVFQQRTSRPWELIIVDDGSTDGTLRIASEYSIRHPDRIRIVKHPDNENLGISASRNLAIQHAQGHYFAFLDSDDVWLPHHLDSQLNILDCMPEVAMVYAAAERWTRFDEAFDEESSRRAQWGQNYLPPLVPRGEVAGLVECGKLLRWFREDESYVPCMCTVVVRGDVARGVGGFCNDFRGLYDDQAFHAKVSFRHNVYAHDVCVARYRQHDESCCGRARQLPENARKEKLRFEAFLRDLVNA